MKNRKRPANHSRHLNRSVLNHPAEPPRLADTFPVNGFQEWDERDQNATTDAGDLYPADGTPEAEPLSGLGNLIRRQWQIVVGIAAAAAVLAWVFAATQPKRYTAEAIAAVAPLTAELTATDVLRGIESLDGRVVVATVAALATSPATLQEAGIGDYSVHAAVLPNTNLFSIEVTGRNPATAAEIANRIPALLASQTRAMYRLYGVTLVSQAMAPEQPVTPRVGRIVATGMAFGLILAVVAAYVFDERRRSS